MDRNTHWPAVFAATFCGVAAAMNIGKLPIAIPQLRAELGLSLQVVGWIVSMFNAMAFTTGVFVGLINGRLGAGRFVGVGLALLSLGVALGMASEGATLLLASRFLEGAGFLAVGVAAPSLASAASSPRDRRMALSVWATYMPLGIGSVTLVAPFVIAAGGWRALWAVTLAMLLAAALAVVANRRHYALAPRRAGWHLRSVREVLGRPTPWLLAFAFSCYTVPFFAIIVWLPTFLTEQRGLSLPLTGLLTAVAILVNILGNILGGVLVQRHYRLGSLLVAFNLFMLACGLGIFSDAVPDLVRYLLCIAQTLFGGVIPACILSSSSVLARGEEQVGTLQGLYVQGSNLGQFFGPPIIVALVSAAGDWNAALPFVVGATLVGMGIGLWLNRHPPVVDAIIDKCRNSTNTSD
jgi:MFS family permease